MPGRQTSGRRPLLTAALTTLTMVAFAANSLLCRMALGHELIDPLSFTTLRLGSGALALAAIVLRAGGANAAPETTGSWRSGLALFAYAAAFSLAYLSLSAGMGALILFAAVQITMIGTALSRGERLGAWQWTGLAAAVGGLVYLVLPGISAPSPAGALLMAISGFAWGVYSVRGRGVTAPVRMTAGNFARAAPLALALSLFGLAFLPTHAVWTGVALALVSGVATSGLGYVLWYRALRDLTTTQASIVQLTVPVIAAFGGVLFLSERVSTRLVVASALILGGVALTVLRNQTPPTATT
ncbi:MAG: DMT family transporter [Gemmatimonadales bacterium]|jgi:drug/metabolite transporter (DMT)-like permease